MGRPIDAPDGGGYATSGKTKEQRRREKQLGEFCSLRVFRCCEEPS